jgi:iron complex transport system permease protein
MSPLTAPRSGTTAPGAHGLRRLAPSYRLLLLALLLGALLLVSLASGAAALPLRTVVDALTGGADPTARAIVLQLRLPRAILAILAGGALAVSGVVFQALLRNPLAEPYVLGVSGGAAVGAVLVVVLGAAVPAPWLLPAAALAGATAAVALVFRVAAGAGRALDTRVLLLAGVMVGAFLNAVVLLLLTLAEPESFRAAFFWIMGSLAGASWRSVTLLALYLVPATALLLAFARSLDLLSLGEETAHHLGVRVERLKLGAYLLASLLTAATVAACGIIGFVGLIVPHALRLLWGSGHRFLLPAAVLAGGAFLLAADTAARTVATPAELPVGVVTALVGVPIFVILLARRRPS